MQLEQCDNKLHSIFVAGPAGAGKTTASLQIAKQRTLKGCPTALIDKDTICGKISGMFCESQGLFNDRDSPLYKELVRDAEYSAVVSTAKENIEAGLSVCLPGPWSTEIRTGAWRKLLSSTEAVGVYLNAKPEVLRERIIQRANPFDQYKLQHWDEFVSKLETAKGYALENGFFVTDSIDDAICYAVHFNKH